MPITKKLLFEIGLDSIVLGLTGLVAIAIGVSEFAGWIQLGTEQLLKMILVAVGLLMAAVVGQAFRRGTEIRELRDELGVVKIKMLDTERSFSESLACSVAKVKKFVLDTAFNFEYAHNSEKTHLDYRAILERRLAKGEISFRKVEVIYNKDRFELIVRRLIKHEGLDYFIRYFKSPPRIIPLLNMQSFDDEHFYLGGYHIAESDAEGYVIYLRHPLFTQFFRGYWKVLWLSAIPLNEAKRINWSELKQLGAHLGLSGQEYDSLIAKIKEEVHTETQYGKRP